MQTRQVAQKKLRIPALLATFATAKTSTQHDSQLCPVQRGSMQRLAQQIRPVRLGSAQYVQQASTVDSVSSRKQTVVPLDQARALASRYYHARRAITAQQE